jgi:hypothetical protein
MQGLRRAQGQPGKTSAAEKGKVINTPAWNKILKNLLCNRGKMGWFVIYLR